MSTEAVSNASDQEDEFMSLKGGEFWNPTKMPDGKTERTTPPTDADVLTGWFIKVEYNKGPNANSCLYSIETEEGNRSVWGSHVMDEQMATAGLGAYVRLQWLGKKQPKKAGGKPYHDWNVGVSMKRGLHPSMAGRAAAPGADLLTAPQAQPQAAPVAQTAPPVQQAPRMTAPPAQGQVAAPAIKPPVSSDLPF